MNLINGLIQLGDDVNVVAAKYNRGGKLEPILFAGIC